MDGGPPSAARPVRGTPSALPLSGRPCETAGWPATPPAPAPASPAGRSRCSAPSTTDHRRLTLTELAERAGLPLPTAHRLVGELVAWGALTRTRTGEYVVGRRLWDLGLLAPAQTGLRELASPYLHDLYGATLATVHLAVRDGTEVLYLDRLRGNASVPIVSTVGSRLPMHATGVGKVLLAHAPADVQAQVLARPDPGHAVHDHPAGPAAPPARPGAAATTTPPRSRR